MDDAICHSNMLGGYIDGLDVTMLECHKDGIGGHISHMDGFECIPTFWEVIITCWEVIVMGLDVMRA